MKKVFSLLLAGIMVLSMCGCSSGGDKEESKKEGNKEETVNNLIDENGLFVIGKTGATYEDNLYGLTDKSGKIKVDCKYNKLSHLFSTYYKYQLEDESGIIDNNGTVKWKQKGGEIWTYDENKAFALSEKDIKIFDENISEPLIIDGVYKGNTEGNFVVERNGKTGIVSDEGKEMLPFKYKAIYAVQNGEGALEACNENRCALLDKDLQEIVSGLDAPEYIEEAYVYIKNISFDQKTEAFLVFKDDKMLAISKDGKKETKPGDSIKFGEDSIVVFDGNESVYYGKDFKKLFSVEGNGYPLENGMATVYAAGEHGGSILTESKIIDKKGNVILSNEGKYNKLSSEQGYMIAEDNEHFTVMDANQKTILDVKNEFFDDEYLEQKESKYSFSIMDIKGEKYFALELQEEEGNTRYAVSTTLYDNKGKKMGDVKGLVYAMGETDTYLTTYLDSESGSQSFAYDKDGELKLDGININSFAEFDDIICVDDEEKGISILYDKETMKEVVRSEQGYSYHRQGYW